MKKNIEIEKSRDLYYKIKGPFNTSRKFDNFDEAYDYYKQLSQEWKNTDLKIEFLELSYGCTGK